MDNEFSTCPPHTNINVHVFKLLLLEIIVIIFTYVNPANLE